MNNDSNLKLLCIYSRSKLPGWLHNCQQIMFLKSKYSVPLKTSLCANQLYKKDIDDPVDLSQNYGAPEVPFKYSGYICLIAFNFFSCDQFLVVT